MNIRKGSGIKSRSLVIKWLRLLKLAEKCCLKGLGKCERVKNFGRDPKVLLKNQSEAFEIERSEKDRNMSRVCQVTGKRPMSGNNVSHANNRNRRRFLPNIHDHRFWLASEKRFVKLRVSAKGMRIIDKLGLEKVLADLKTRGERV